MNEAVVTAITIQMNNELHNFYVYKSFSGVADYCGLVGATSWLDKQADEEKSHFNRFFTYLCDKGIMPTLLPLADVKPEKITLTAMFAKIVDLETKTTANLEMLAKICKAVEDDQTYELVLNYLKEQVEEEKSVSDIYQRLLLVGEGVGTIIIDNELSER